MAMARNEGGVSNIMNRGKEAQERHRRYLYQESEIVAFQRDFNNKEKTLAKFDIRSRKTLTKIMKRWEKRNIVSHKDNLATPHIFNWRAAYSDREGCFDHLVQAIFRRAFMQDQRIAELSALTELLQDMVSDLEDQVAERDVALAKLESERSSWPVYRIEHESSLVDSLAAYHASTMRDHLP